MAAAVSPQPPPNTAPPTVAAAPASSSAGPAATPAPSGPAAEEAQNSKLESSKGEKWAFIEPQPIREEQVKNAVNFLSHPRVRGSPIVHRRSFLERKGLTREEIDEAFRRVPDPPSNESAKSTVSTEGKLTTTQMGTTQSQQKVQPSVDEPPQAVVKARSGPHWSHLIVGAGFLAAAGAGTGYLFQRVLVPKLKAWMRDIVIDENKGRRPSEEGKPTKLTPIEEAIAAAAAAANAAALAATEVANTSKELLKSRTEEWQQLRAALKSLEIQTEDINRTFKVMDKDTQRVPVQGQRFLDEFPSSNYYKGSMMPLQRTSTPPEQIQMRPGITGVQNKGLNGQISNGHSSVHDGYGSQADEEAWWRRKKIEKETVIAPNHEEGMVRITDVDSISDQDMGSPGRYASRTSEEPWWQKKAKGESYVPSRRDSDSSVQISEISSARSIGGSVVGRQGWVPPPVPQTVMPGAFNAIRYQKPATIGDVPTVVSQEKEMDSQADLAEVSEISSVDKEIPSSSTMNLIEESATDANV